MEFENLIKLIETVSESKLTGLKYEENGVKLNLTKTEGKVQIVSAPSTSASTPMQTTDMNMAGMTMPAMAPSANQADTAVDSTVENAVENSGKHVECPLVGTFYSAPSEDAEAFVKVGDTVKKGQVLAIVEAMKLMNEIESEYDGVIEEILVENGQAVEYGQPLFRIK